METCGDVERLRFSTPCLLLLFGRHFINWSEHCVQFEDLTKIAEDGHRFGGWLWDENAVMR